MSKRAGVILYCLTIASLGMGTAALIVRASELRVLNSTYNLIRDLGIEYHFADIVEHYDDDGDN